MARRNSSRPPRGPRALSLSPLFPPPRGSFVWRAALSLVWRAPPARAPLYSVAPHFCAWRPRRLSFSAPTGPAYPLCNATHVSA